MNISDAIYKNSIRRSDFPAIVEPDGTYLSYMEYELAVQNWAILLQKVGVKNGDIIGVNLKDTSDHLIALFAVPRSGSVILPFDWRWTDDEKRRLANFFRPKAILSEPDDTFLEVDGFWKHIAVDANWKNSLGKIDAGKQFSSSTNPNLLLALSSGTTGTPRGPMITHQQFLARFLIYFISLSFSERDRYLCATPLYFGGCRGYCMCTLFSGGTVLLYPPPYDVDSLVSFANKYSATRCFLVPTLLRRLMCIEGGSSENPVFKTLELLFSTGAALHAEERAELMDRFCKHYINFYGSTDGGGCTTLGWDDPASVANSVGKPVFGAELQIIDPSNNLLPSGRIGRIRYKHPGTANCYYNDPEASAKTFVDGWYLPGDLGWVNEDGYLFIAGRESDMIIRGGANIYPSEIEHTLMNNEKVLESAVVGIPSREFGEEIIAFIILKDEKNKIDSKELVKFCQKHLAPYKIPKEFYFLKALPKSGVGKVLKKELEKLRPK